jgi:hypothetical protein
MNRKLFLLIILSITLGFSFKVFALEVTWPSSPFGTDLDTACTPITNPSCTLTLLVKYFYEWGIFIGGLAVLISLLIGGFLYLTSVGNPTRMSEAKDRIFSAIIGLVLLFSIYLILNTINPDLTVLTTPTISPPSSSLLIECDTTTADCPANYECKGDPNPGDGKKEGICLLSTNLSTAPCDEAILYKEANYNTEIKRVGKGAGCVDLANKGETATVKSIKYSPDNSSCTTYLYSETGCGENPRLIISTDTPDLETRYKITEFGSVEVTSP